MGSEMCIRDRTISTSPFRKRAGNRTGDDTVTIVLNSWDRIVRRLLNTASLSSTTIIFALRMKPPLFSHAKIRSFPGSQCPIFRQIQSFTNVSSDFICHIPRNRIALNQQTDKTMESISLKLIFRSWWRNKTFAVISLLSLAAGITCTNLLISYVIYESRIEAHNPNKSHIILSLIHI